IRIQKFWQEPLPIPVEVAIGRRAYLNWLMLCSARFSRTADAVFPDPGVVKKNVLFHEAFEKSSFALTEAIAEFPNSVEWTAPFKLPLSRLPPGHFAQNLEAAVLRDIEVYRKSKAWLIEEMRRQAEAENPKRSKFRERKNVRMNLKRTMQRIKENKRLM